MRAFALLTLAAALAGCGGLGSHDVELTVLSPMMLSDAVVGSIKSLEVGASTKGKGGAMTYSLTRPLSRTERITVHVTNDQGQLDIGIIAHDSSGAAVAAGHNYVKLDGNGPHSAPVTLMAIGASGQLFNISPMTYTLFTGETASFSASADVVWSVQEPGGGTIDQMGTYMAPMTAGTYTVVASASGFYGHTQTATVQVLSSGVVNFAGQLGGGGYADGPLGTGRLILPMGMVSDGTSIFFTTQDKLVRKLDIKSGTLSTIAGALDLPAPTDGTGAQAHFGDPRQIALDSTGNLYVADSGSNDIRKVEIATGKVTTFAGKAGVGGTLDGVGSAAAFSNPLAIAWDGARTLFVGDPGACNIRKIDIPTAMVTTLAGTPSGMPQTCGFKDGTGTAAQFGGINSIAYDGQGTLWVAEYQHLRKVVVATGVVTSTQYSLNTNSIASDGNGGLWIASGTVGQVDPSSGAVTTVMPPPPSVGTWYLNAQSLAFAPDGTLYVGSNEAILSLDAANRSAKVIGGVLGYSNSLAYKPSVAGPLSATLINFVNGLDVGSDGIIYTRANDTWLAIDPVARTSTKVMGPLDYPCCTDLRSDGKGTIYTVGYDGTFRSFPIGTTSGATIIAGNKNSGGFADGTGTAALFNQPDGLAIDWAHGTAYIADTNNAIIRKVVIASGQVTTFLGTANMVGYVDDIGTAARLAHPRALVYDGAGTLYFGDDNHIRKATVPGGLVSTVAGANSAGSADGPPGTGQVYSPNGMVLDAAKQNLYVTDQLNNTLRRVELATGNLTTVAGIVGHAVDAPGPLGMATLNQPQQIVLDGAGDLLVATPREQSILRIRLP